jgi:hypothetical protein
MFEINFENGLVRLQAEQHGQNLFIAVGYGTRLYTYRFEFVDDAMNMVCAVIKFSDHNIPYALTVLSSKNCSTKDAIGYWIENLTGIVGISANLFVRDLFFDLLGEK